MLLDSAKVLFGHAFVVPEDGAPEIQRDVDDGWWNITRPPKSDGLRDDGEGGGRDAAADNFMMN